MSYKVVRRSADNAVVAFGPDADGYQPVVKAGEVLAVEADPPTLPAQPDVEGFEGWCESNMTFSLRNNVHKAYPRFSRDLDEANWTDFQAGCIVAKSDAPLTNGQWAAFKNAVATYRIPVTLP